MSIGLLKPMSRPRQLKTEDSETNIDEGRTVKKTSWIVIGLAAVLSCYVVWRVGFNAPAPGMSSPAPKPTVKAKTSEPNQPAKAGSTSSGYANDAKEPNRPSDTNRDQAAAGPNDVNAPRPPAGMMEQFRSRRGGRGDFGGPPGGDFGGRPGGGFGGRPGGEPNDPNQAGMESLNLNNVEMKDIINRVAEWTGKVVIPVAEAMQQRVTIYAPKRVPRKEALSLIYNALRTKGYVIEDANNVLYIKPIEQSKWGTVPTIPDDQPLEGVDNKDMVAQRFFRLKNYSPSDMASMIQPLVGQNGYVSSDMSTGTLLVIDTVSSLIRIERIIKELDVPEAGQTQSEVVQLERGDPVEIVQLLKLLMDTKTGSTGSRQITAGGGSSSSGSDGRGGFDSRGGPFGGRPSGSTSQQGSASYVMIPSSRVPIIMIPEPTRRWIIVRASAQDLKTVKEWITKLDREDPIKSEYETIQLTYADAAEVAARIDETMKQMTTSGVLPNVLIKALTQTRQIVIYGRLDLRDMIKGIIAKIDIPIGDFETKTFTLKHADPDTVKTNIDTLYGQTSTSSYRSYGGYGQSSRTSSNDVVKTTSFPSLQQLTVIASPDNMRKIEKQIEEWDGPLDIEKLKPRIIELRNSDPVQMADLMTTLFSSDSSSSSSTQAFRMMMMYGGSETTASKGKIVGPLYGQLTFENVPGTKKIIVISKIPEAYDVVEKLILDLDRTEMAEVPEVVQLKYADPQKLAELLNALFNETGTRAAITTTAAGLSATDTTGSSSSSGSGSSSGGGAGGGGATGSTSGTSYTPWWNTARTSTTEQPVSNVIGKVRFIPDPHSKSILVLAPPEFQESLAKTIHQLDVPGKQVMVKAVILNVDHKDATSLGLQLASNPQAFGNLNENAMTAVSQLIRLDKGGNNVFSTGGTSTIGAATTATSTNVGGTETAHIFAGSVDFLVDFLVKQVNAKVLNQQTLWTKDNEEASFFKGDTVAFSGGTSVTQNSTTQDYTFEDVGMTLRVRPRITPESDVDMIVNVQLSDLTSDLVNQQPKRTKMQTTTNMIVQNGQTVMLGGILFQTDSKILRKVALLGDIPLLGELFRHNAIVKSNSEMIVFITPYVVDEGRQITGGAAEQLKRPLEALKDAQEEMKVTGERLEQQLK